MEPKPTVTTTIEKTFDPEVLKAVGALMITAGFVEQALTLQLLRLLGHPNETHATALPAISGMEVRTKLSIIRATGAMHAPAHSKAISDCCRDIQDAIDKRHILAHSYIAKGRKAHELEIQKLRIGTDGNLEKKFHWTTDQIRQFTNVLGDSSIKLDACLTSAGIRGLNKSPSLQPERER